MDKVTVYDPTADDKLSSVRGIGRYLELLRENFPEWSFIGKLPTVNHQPPTTFINPFFNFLRPPLTFKRLANKQIAVIHDLIPVKYPERFPAGFRGNLNIFLNKLALRNYDQIITDSEASRKDIIDILNIPGGRIKVIYPCLPKSFAENELRNTKYETNSNLNIVSDFDIGASKFCLYVGDATWNKNLVNLAKALKIINVTCIFVGKVFGKETRQLVNSQNNKWLTEFKEFLKITREDKRFVFAGYIPDSNLIKIYKQATLNILPSRDEGFGFSFLEAGNFSCPSVLSSIPVLKEISGGQGLFADPGKPNDIADRIGELYFNPDIRDQWGKEAQKRSAEFSAKKFRKGFEKIII